MTWEADTAHDLAVHTAQFGEQHQTEAIGHGLAAIAYALLDVARAIRQHTEATSVE